MKKLFCLMVTQLLVFSLLPEARADVIYEPQDDFYMSHRDACQYHNRNYTANGPNGDVTVYESPESDKKIKAFANGTQLYISYLYQDASGITWGYQGGWEEEAGWIPMDYLELIYDFISFQEEHGHEFEAQEGVLGEAWKGKIVYFWAYPGSANASTFTMTEENMPRYDMVYTDANGIRWGQCGYYFGMRDFWICLDAPDADYETLFPDAMEPALEETQETIPADPVDEIKPEPKVNSIYVVLAVAAVVAVTVLLLVKLKKK